MNSTHSGYDEVVIRTMRSEDIPFAMEVKSFAGWNQTARDWAGYLEFEADGCFIAETRGRKVGTATAIDYDGRFGWIGMVLVHPEARRAGIGTKLLQRTIDYLRQRGVRCVKLDATPMGRNVYLPMGFQDEYEISRFEGTTSAIVSPAAGTDTEVQPLTQRDLPELVTWDAEVFGAERERVLRSLSERNPELSYVLRTDGKVAGYIIARYGCDAVQVGPWAAECARAGERLWRTFLQRVPEQRVFVDVPHPNTASVSLMKGTGFTVQRGFTRMILGENAHRGNPDWVFGTSSAEKG